MKTDPFPYPLRSTPARRWPFGFLLTGAISAAGLLINGCGQMGSVYSYQTGDTPMLGQTTYLPKDFFTGQQLNIARAIAAGDMNEVRRLAPGVNLTATGQRDMTLMWFAIMRQNYEAVKTLVALGVDPDKQIAHGFGSALYYAMWPRKDTSDQSGIRLLQAMLDGGLSPNYKTDDQTSLLQRAAGAFGTMAAVQLRVERGADINARDRIGRTALSDAISSDNPEIALYLINHRADINTHTISGVTVGWGVYKTLERINLGIIRSQFEQLRDLMIKKGVKWPPDSPEVVRDQMRAQGLTPLVPPGHKR
jgi:hypothetical protein